MRIQKCPIFDSRFVPHRHIWLKNDNDVCYECIDRRDYSSVVVRLQRFATSDIQLYKIGIQKAVDKAIQHDNLCRLKEVLIDEENKITVSVSENARGISFQRFMDLCSSKPGYEKSIRHILSTILNLYQDLHAANLDLSSLPLDHTVISFNNTDLTVNSVKIRRSFLCKLEQKKDCTLPYSNFGTFPAFVNVGAAAYYSFTKQDFFEQQNLQSAITQLEPSQKAFFQILFAIENADFKAAKDVIQNMHVVEATILLQPEWHESENDKPICEQEELEPAIDDSELHQSLASTEVESKTPITAEKCDTESEAEPDTIDECAKSDSDKSDFEFEEDGHSFSEDSESDDADEICSLSSNESDYDVIEPVEVGRDSRVIFVAKNYGMEGLNVKIFDTNAVRCELDDQFVIFNSENAEIDASASRNLFDGLENLHKIIGDIRLMAEIAEQKYTATFSET